MFKTSFVAQDGEVLLTVEMSYYDHPAVVRDAQQFASRYASVESMPEALRVTSVHWEDPDGVEHIAYPESR